MAPLTWNLIGWTYQDGIRNLRETFAAATEGVNQRLQAAYEALDEHDRQVAARGDPQIERDDDGCVIYDHRDTLIYQTTTAEEAKDALNKAIVIAIFHHWERSAREWTSLANGKFKTLCDEVLAKGYAIDPRLDDLHLVVNLLKHANAKHGVELMERRPQWFRRTFAPASPRIEWYEEVSLGDADVDELFGIVAASGPDDRTGV